MSLPKREKRGEKRLKEKRNKICIHRRMERVLRGPLSCTFRFHLRSIQICFLPWYLEKTHAQTHKSLDIYLYITKMQNELITFQIYK